MARTSPVHYIAPSAISITPNANGSHRDLAVYVAKGAKIKVRCPRAGIGMDGDTSTYQEWTLSGRNRRLADTTGTQEYTIYARLPKSGYNKGYLVFAPKTGSGKDKWQYLTLDDDAIYGITSIEGATTSNSDWYVLLGEVSAVENGQRTVTLDTGILGTDQYNDVWVQSPDNLPLRIELGCTIDDEDAGPTPYVYWGQSLVLTASLVEGWTGTDIQRFDHWEITRDSGDSDADDAWNHPTGAGSYHGLTDGQITLSHARGYGDDFNGAVSATFTVVAMGRPEEGSESQDLVVLKTAVINIHAETVEKYELAMTANIVGYNPMTQTYDPASIVILIRATDQRGDVFELTKGQFDNAGLAVQYAAVGSVDWHALNFTGASNAVATATLTTATVFAAQQSINVRLMRIVETDDGSTAIELMQQTIAFVRDGEDSKEREWIFYRSAEAITFGTQAHPYPASVNGGQVNPSGAATGNDTNKNQDGWVPQGWWDEQRGVDSTNRFEYGAYRDYIHESDSSSSDSSSSDSCGGHWGPFTTPKIWNHYGKDGEDGQDTATAVCMPAVVSIPTDGNGVAKDDFEQTVLVTIYTNSSDLTSPEIQVTSGGGNVEVSDASVSPYGSGDITFNGETSVFANGEFDGETLVLGDGTSFSTGTLRVTAKKGDTIDEHLCQLMVYGYDTDGTQYRARTSLGIQRNVRGADGDTPLAVYAWNQSTDTPPTISGNAYPPTGWSKRITTRPGDGWYLWMAESTRHADGTIDAWGVPVRITGEDGNPGADAKDTEWIYRLDTDSGYNGTTGTAGGQTVSGDARYTTDDFVPTNWSDNPLSVSNDHKTEYASFRKYNTSTGRWGNFSEPVVWSHWGERGTDGDGVEYVFIRTNSDAAPTITNSDDTYDGKTYLDDDYRPLSSAGRCTDDAVGVDSTHKYEWAISRTKTDPDSSGVRTWTKYSGTMKLWATYSESITKQSEVAYYIKNTTGVRPAENDSNWSTTKPTVGKGEWLFTKTVITWSDGNTTVLYTDSRNPNDGVAGQDIIVDGSTVMKYYVGDSNTTHPADNSSDWKDLSQVTQTQGKWLWSQATTYYRKASSAAGSHDAGSSINYSVSYISKDGANGRGIKSSTELYQATNSSAARQKPTSDSGWSTDPNLLDLTNKWTETYKYLWNCEKTVYTNSDGSETTEYTVPRVIAIWTKDGSAGKGIDSITNYYRISSASTGITRPQTDGASPWDDDPMAPTEEEPFLWNYEKITWLNYGSGQQYTYTDPHVIGHYGADGNDVATAVCMPAVVSIPTDTSGRVIEDFEKEVAIVVYTNDDDLDYPNIEVTAGGANVDIDSAGIQSRSDNGITFSGETTIVANGEFSGETLVLGDDSVTLSTGSIKVKAKAGDLLTEHVCELMAWGYDAEGTEYRAYTTLTIQRNVRGANGDTPLAVYAWNQNPDTAPSISGNDYPPAGWTTRIISRPGDGWYLWMAESTRHADGTIDAWGVPVRITGEDGNPGADAKDMEWIYRLDTNSGYNGTTGTAPDTDPDSPTYGQRIAVSGDARYTTDDFVPTNWSDNPLSVSNDNKTEYASCRKYNASTGRWGDFSSPVVWSHWGERGTDGDGVEYVFARTATATPPKVSDNNSYTSGGKTYSYTDDEFLPAVTGAKTMSGTSVTDQTRATDDPQGVSDKLPYEWVTKRTKGVPNVQTGKRSWNQYAIGDMQLWAKYGKNGAPGTLYQRMYQSTNSGTWSGNLPANYVDGNNGWYIAPTAITSSARYRWVTERRSDDEGTTWGSGWSTPQIDTYLASDGTSFTIKGRAVLVIPSGDSYSVDGATPADLEDDGYLGDASVVQEGDCVLYNNDVQSDKAFLSGSSFVDDQEYANAGDGYISLDGHLWVRNRSGLRWTDCGQIKGDKGEDGKSVYSLGLSASVIKFSKDYAGVVTANPSSFTILLQYGGENISLPNGYYIYYRYNDGTNWSNWFSGSLGTKNPNNQGFFNNGSHTVVEFCLTKESDYRDVTDANIIDRKTITAVWEYQRMLIPAGAYENRQYSRTANTTPLVWYNNTYWFLVADNNGTGTFTAPGADSSVWQQAAEFDVILTKMLFAEFARLGSFIVYDHYFLSQYGTLISPNGDTVIINTVSANNLYYRIDGQNGIDFSPSYSEGFMPAYSYFDANDPMAEGYASADDLMFRPMKCINALTGEEWAAGGKVHFNPDGSGELAGGNVSWDADGNTDIKGSLTYHNTFIDRSSSYVKLYQMYNASGQAVSENYSGTVTKYKLLYDTIVIGGSERINTHTVFGTTETGYTVMLPPASYFPGVRIKIINATIAGGNGTAANLSPSQINLGVVYREDMEVYTDGDLSYAFNMIAAARPITVAKNNHVTFVGAPDHATAVTNYNLGSSAKYDVHVLRGDMVLSGDSSSYVPVRYRSFELVSQRNPYTSSGYAWIIIDAQEA